MASFALNETKKSYRFFVNGTFPDELICSQFRGLAGFIIG